MKKITIDGRTYTLSVRSYDGLIAVKGTGIVGGIVLPDGVTLESSDLREQVRDGVAANRESARAAALVVQDRIKTGTAGLGGA